MDRERAGKEHNDCIEIVVVPVAADPRGIGRIGIGRRSEPEDEAHQDEANEPARA
jgi:hypothetical protein